MHRSFGIYFLLYTVCRGHCENLQLDVSSVESDIDTASLSKAESEPFLQDESPVGNTSDGVCLTLPSFPKISEPHFLWGDVDGNSFSSLLEHMKKFVHWRENVFLLLFGKSGKMFVSELAHFI